MKNYLKYLSIVFSFLALFSSCEKQNTSTQLHRFYKLKVNGASKTIEACGSTDHIAQFLQDTAVFVGFGCDGKRAGFYLIGKVIDGTYLLDNKNSAWYDEGSARYQTDSLNTGTLTVTTSVFQGVAQRIPIIKGTFSFNAIDKNTGQKIKVTSGQYLLEKRQY